MTKLDLAIRALRAASSATQCAPCDPDGVVWDECTARYARKCVRRAYVATFRASAYRGHSNRTAGHMARCLGLGELVPARWYGWQA